MAGFPYFVGICLIGLKGKSARLHGVELALRTNGVKGG